MKGITIDLAEMKVVELRAELKRLGLPIQGLKADLVRRLQSELDLERKDNVPIHTDKENTTVAHDWIKQENKSAEILMTTPLKDVLNSVDSNKSCRYISTSGNRKAWYTPTLTPRTPSMLSPSALPRGIFSPPLPRQARKLGVEERAEKFDLICKLRVGEDMYGDLAEVGIQEWSVDDFDYVQKLGSGGVAQVYLAVEKQSGHQVALKVQEANDSSFCEIDLHMELVENGKDNCPNVLHIVDYFYSSVKFGPVEDKIPNCEEEDGADHHYLYSILEVCEGGDLYQFIDKHYGNVPESLAAKYIRDAIAALEQVHASDMIHCDIKPANFLIDNDNNLKLADFGMAVRLEEKEVLGGSPVYMAPEHLLAWKKSREPFAPCDFDQRVDIYSLGVVMYEVLMGFLPYDIRGTVPDEEVNELVSAVAALELDSGSEEDDDCDSGFPILDVRKLEGEEPFVLPTPIFDGGISDEAQNLIIRFLEADVDKRISLDEAKEHDFFKKHQM